MHTFYKTWKCLIFTKLDQHVNKMVTAIDNVSELFTIMQNINVTYNWTINLG